MGMSSTVRQKTLQFTCGGIFACAAALKAAGNPNVDQIIVERFRSAALAPSAEYLAKKLNVKLGYADAPQLGAVSLGGAGIAWSNRLYMGPNGPIYARKKPVAESVVSLLTSIRNGARKVNPKLRVMAKHLDDEPGPVIDGNFVKSATLQDAGR